MSENVLKYAFPVEELEKIAFPVEKEADVLSNTDRGEIKNEEPQNGGAAPKKEDPDAGIQDLTEGDGKDFSQNLTNFLQKKKEDGNRDEKVNKAETLGLIDSAQPQQ